MDTDLAKKIGRMFRSVDWKVIVLKYGKEQCKAFQLEGGRSLKKWIDGCDSQVFSILCFKGGAEFRRQILADLPHDSALAGLLASYSDTELFKLMTNLGITLAN